jgi:hypothetical protein
MDESGCTWWPFENNLKFLKKYLLGFQTNGGEEEYGRGWAAPRAFVSLLRPRFSDSQY